MLKSKVLYFTFLYILVVVISLADVSAQASTYVESPKTKVVILGVGHSTQLVAESYQPAVIRAFINRVKPDAICIERSPQEFSRNDFYEFTFEQQYLTVPFARENQIPLYPVDWLPDSEDTLLAFNLADLEKPPFVRNTSGFLGFINITGESSLSTDLFYAESADSRSQQKQFANSIPPKIRFDFARRLYLYRTFMQSMRILRAATANPGKTVLVIIGSLHKNDIEQILETEQSIGLIQPSSFGHPTEKEISDAVKVEDFFAIASFNLLGTQSRTANVNWDWMRRIIAKLEEKDLTPETILLKTRLQILTKQISSQNALETYQRIYEGADESKQFLWTGVKDKSRIDSYFDPFGNLSLKQRALLEMAREYSKLKQIPASDKIRKQLQGQLSVTKAQQLEAYWEEHLLRSP